MPYFPHMLASFRGILADVEVAPIETWSINLRFGTEDSASGGGPVATQAVADAFKAAAFTLFTNAGAKFSNSVYFQEVRLYQIGTDGKSTIEPKISAVTAPARGVSSTTQHPWQCSTVVSLTANGLGKGKRGRFYLPPQNLLIAQNGVITDTDVTNTRTAVVAFLNELNDTTTTGITSALAIAGKTGAQGTLRTVRHVAVGNVMDTQRRRRRQLEEVRVDALGTFTEYQLAG